MPLQNKYVRRKRDRERERERERERIVFFSHLTCLSCFSLVLLCRCRKVSEATFHLYFAHFFCIVGIFFAFSYFFTFVSLFSTFYLACFFHFFAFVRIFWYFPFFSYFFSFFLQHFRFLRWWRLRRLAARLPQKSQIVEK